MRTPRVLLCTLVLNEMEWLPRLYAQHRHWPGRVGWVFVESADREYAKTNPDRVSADGLSVDGTTDFLRNIDEQDPYVVHVPYGYSQSPDPAQGKCRARSEYLRVAEDFKPDFIVVVDADEFYPKQMQERIGVTLAANDAATGFVFRHREIWRPPSMLGRSDYPLFSQEVVGGFWSIPYCRVWRWESGLRYESNHNTPQTRDGRMIDEKLARYDGVEGSPYYCHMAFASSSASRDAKHRYYEQRGEARDLKRKWYCDSRRAWETWTPNDELPRGAKVVPYDGIIPECFR